MAWSLGIGDPTFVGWLTAFAYLATAWLAQRAFRRSHDAGRSERTFWCLLVPGLVLLGLNKQLDLQTAFIQGARRLLWARGWYEQRSTWALAFVAAVGLAGLALGLWIAVTLRRASRGTWLAIAGCAGLLGFVVLRAASFSGIGARGGGAGAAVCELGSIAVIVAGALMRARESR